MRGPQQCPNAEAVRVFPVADLRLLQQRVQFLPDVRLNLVMAIALCEGSGQSKGGHCGRS